MRRAFPVPVAERLLRSWDDRHAFAAALARLPRTLCHFDIAPQNLFTVRDMA